MTSAILLGAAPVVPPPPEGWQFPFLKAGLPLIGALLVAALVIYFVDRWRKRADRVTLAPGDQLSHFRSLYERGEMTPEEFERVKGLLTGQMRKELNVPAPPPAPEAPPSRD